MTAWNPQGKTLPPDVNNQRQEDLRTALGRGGYEVAEGESEPADGHELAECRLLVFGITEPEAVALAQLYDQLAIVAVRQGYPARLLEIKAP